jgi:zinc transporter 9
MAGNSKASVIAGVSANALITIAKFVGFFVSGSAALLSEAIHSVADTGNQSLLLLGLARSQRPPDPSHPYGYARDRFFWGLVSALGIFFLGAGVTLYHGIHGLMDPHVVHHTWLTWAVLGASLCIEGWAGLVALRGVRKDAKAAGMGFFRYLREGRDPTIFAVLLEDTAAVIGVIMAALCIVLGEITGSAFWDPLASLLVGILLAVVAIVLVMQNRQFLTIRAVDSDVQDRIKKLMEAQDTVASIGGFRAVMLGVDTFHVSAGVRFKGDKLAARVLADTDLAAVRAAASDDTQLRAWAASYSQRLAEEMGREVDDIERKVREVFPAAERIQLETKG